MDGHNIQPVEQVLAEATGLDLAREILVGRGYYPHVHPNRLRTTDPRDDTLLQGAQHLGLRGHGHVTNFVQKQGAVIGLLEPAPPIGYRTGERSLDVPE